MPADPMVQKAQVSEVTKGKREKKGKKAGKKGSAEDKKKKGLAKRKRREKSDSPELGFQKLPALSGLAAFFMSREAAPSPTLVPPGAELPDPGAGP